MVMEVLGSRVLGPFFGVSLFVWTSLIAVTLVALALGYATGGVLSDRSDGPGALYGIILAAGFLILVIPFAKASALKSCMAFGLRVGSLASAALLFGPSSFLLGCVSPTVIKIAAREAKSLGKTVGIFYAVSTIGSFLGTLLAGFAFLAYVRTDRIFYFAGAALVVLAVFYFLLYAKKPLAVMALVPVLLLQPPAGVLEKTQADGTHVAALFSSDTFYGKVKVLEYSPDRGPHIRELMIDGLVQGGIDTANGMSVYRYPYLMEFLPYGTNPEGKTCLVLGLGAGIVPMWYEAIGVQTEVVDVNPVIPGVAEKYFGFRTSGKVIISDARYVLSSAQKKYDYIIVDVASGDWATHVLTLESFRLLRNRLTGKGVVAINVIGSLGKDPLMTASIVRTLKEVFRIVKVYITVDPFYGADIQNLEVIAYDDPELSFDFRRIRKFPVHYQLRGKRGGMFVEEFTFSPGTPSIILSDDYNPVDFFDIRIREKIRKSILTHVDWDMLI